MRLLVLLGFAQPLLGASGSAPHAASSQRVAPSGRNLQLTPHRIPTDVALLGAVDAPTVDPNAPGVTRGAACGDIDFSRTQTWLQDGRSFFVMKVSVVDWCAHTGFQPLHSSSAQQHAQQLTQSGSRPTHAHCSSYLLPHTLCLAPRRVPFSKVRLDFPPSEIEGALEIDEVKRVQPADLLLHGFTRTQVFDHAKLVGIAANEVTVELGLVPPDP
eukprot:gene340-2670_t